MFSISRSKPQNNPELPKPPRLASLTDIFLILLLGTGAVVMFPALSSRTPEKVKIYRDNRLIATYPLDTDRLLHIAGVLDSMEITIKNRSVAVTKADCPHGICRKTGSIKNPRSQIVCAPNHILITITSSGNDTLDAIVR